MNIRCSNRCAKPVRFFSSKREPTRTIVLTDTIGSAWSSWRITVRPFGRVYFVKGMLSFAGGAPPAELGPSARTDEAGRSAAPSAAASHALRRIDRNGALIMGEAMLRPAGGRKHRAENSALR